MLRLSTYIHMVLCVFLFTDKHLPDAWATPIPDVEGIPIKDKEVAWHEIIELDPAKSMYYKITV